MRYARSPEWVHKRVLDGTEGILVPLISTEADLSAMLMLNETAIFIWELLELPQSFDEIRNKLESCFEFESEQQRNSSREDLHHCLKELTKLGALKLS